MHLDAGVDRRHRRRALVVDAGGGGADQHQLAGEVRSRRSRLEHIAGRDVFERPASRPAGAAKRDPNPGVFVHRDGVAPAALLQHHVDQGSLVLSRKPRQHMRRAGEAPEHRQRQRFVVLVPDSGDQRQAAHQAVGVGREVEIPGRRRGAGQHVDVGRVAVPLCEGAAAALQQRGIERGRRQGAGLAPAAVARQVVAQHRLAPAQGAGETKVVVEFGAPAGQAHSEIGQFVCEAFEQRQGGAGVGLGEQHVEADDGRSLAREQLVGERSHLLPAPRPAADFGQALFVDIDDHDARIERARHQRTQARVANGQIELGDEAQGQVTCRMGDGHQHCPDQQGNPQHPPEQGARRHAGRRNQPLGRAARWVRRGPIRPGRTASACPRVRSHRRF